MPVHDIAQFEVHQERVVAQGGHAMFLHLANGKWLVRFIIPEKRRAKKGKYSEGFSSDFGAALAQAVAGLD